ncbi:MULTISPECIES: ATP-binding protein [unclassified Streptomyces]|uniref:sensor histidine kinase n=1 Tax=unclassified Streptomyces TaxID=2593676 RepID=UPI0029B8AFF3|nr:ATP-binding protein [Streptomyces sp. DK15]MDX2388755.1 ATP-binding protein [Streptomyces sp. DK15]
MFRFPRPPRSLAGQLFAMQVLLVAVVVAGCAVFAYAAARGQAEDAARRQAGAVARAVADSPSVQEAVGAAAPGADPSAALQPYAERVRTDSGVDFVTIMTPDGRRWTHPDPRRIGERFLGNTAPALRGETFSETYTGTLGPSIRVVTPLTDRDGRITGLVSAGITVRAVSDRLAAQLSALAWWAAGALALGAVGTYVVNARLRRHTHGMNAAELSRMYDYHQAALHGVREGLLMLDGQRRITLINDAGRELLDLRDEVTGRGVADLGLPAPLTGALLSDRPRVDEVHLSAQRVLVVNSSPVAGGGRRGTVVTLRDHTELQSLTGELDHERAFTQALRSQAHEAANRLHTVVSLIELGRSDEAVDFATAELELAQALTDEVVTAVGEPVLVALLLGKAAQAHERGIELVVTPDSGPVDGAPGIPPARDLVTVLGNLIDNAVDALTGVPGGRIAVTVRREAGGLFLRVSDNGPGLPDGVDVFRRGWSGKGEGRGLGLALVRQVAHRHGGAADAAVGTSGYGAEFTVRLPSAPEPESNSDPRPTPEPESEPAAVTDPWREPGGGRESGHGREPDADRGERAAQDPPAPGGASVRIPGQRRGGEGPA